MIARVAHHKHLSSRSVEQHPAGERGVPGLGLTGRSLAGGGMQVEHCSFGQPYCCYLTLIRGVGVSYS